MIRNDLKIENTCGLRNMIGRGGDGDRARKTCDYDTHLTHRRSLTNTPFSSPISPSLESMLLELQAQTKIDTPEESNSSGPDCLPNLFQPAQPAPTNDLLQQLIQAMAMMGWAAAATNPPPTLPTPMPSATTRIRAPDAFDGANPEDLRPFLLQCQLIFNSYPQQYATESSKVFFAISYLKKLALEWFEHGVMETDPNHAPTW